MGVDPRILLIHPPSNCVEDDRLEPPLGLLYLASTLKENGFDDVSVFDMTGCKSEEEISDKIGAIGEAVIYGIECFSTNYNYMKRIVNHIREKSPLAYVVVGGPHPTGLPDFTLEDSGADVVVVGEGEDIFFKIVRDFSKGSPQEGILIGIGRDDIDSYAFPARDLIDMSTYSRELLGQPVVSVLSSRGCAHHCIHCNSVVMGGGNLNVRYRSPDNVIEEMKTLRDEYANFRFNDDHFTGNPNLEELLIKMKDLDIKFRIFARVEDLDEKTCRLLMEAGCVHASIGLETLNPDNLKILGKKTQIGKESNIRNANEHCIIVRSSFMVGLPFDTDETITDSFERAAESGIDEFAVYALIPYPGTAIWKFPERFGYRIVDRDFTGYMQIGKGHQTCYALEHENFGIKDVQRWRELGTEIFEKKGFKSQKASQVAR